MSRFFTLAIATTLACCGAHAQAGEQLDHVLEELKALRQHVAQLEQRVQELESSKATAPELSATAPAKQSWMDNLRIELNKADARASGPWTTPSNWDSLKKGLTREQAIALLGEPTRVKFSVRKDTDEILVYEGDLTGSGEPVTGEIRIYKGKVARFQIPDFPEP